MAWPNSQTISHSLRGQWNRAHLIYWDPSIPHKVLTLCGASFTVLSKGQVLLSWMTLVFFSLLVEVNLEETSVNQTICGLESFHKLGRVQLLLSNVLGSRGTFWMLWDPSPVWCHPFLHVPISFHEREFLSCPTRDLRILFGTTTWLRFLVARLLHSHWLWT